MNERADLPDSPSGDAVPAAADAHQALGARIDALTAAVSELTRIGKDRERVIDRLHEENQKLRAGEIQQALAPVIRDLIRLYDDLAGMAESCSNSADDGRRAMAKDWEIFSDTVLDMLYRQGVERFKADAGTAFNAREHNGKGFITSDDKNLDNTIARMVRYGFQGAAGIVRHAQVEVYRCKPVDKSSSAEAGSPPN